MYTDGTREYKVTFTSEYDGMREDTATSQQQPVRLAQLGRIAEETPVEETGWEIELSSGWGPFMPGVFFKGKPGEEIVYTRDSHEYKVTVMCGDLGVVQNVATKQTHALRRIAADGSCASVKPRVSDVVAEGSPEAEPEGEPRVTTSEDGDPVLAPPGYYRIAKDGTAVTEMPSVDSKDVAALKADTIVHVSEVVVDQGRTRGRVDSEPPGWVSLVKHEGGQRWATKEGDPGTYTIEVDGTAVTEAASVDSSDVTKLPVGTVVEVVEVAVQKERIRGRIVEPAGWISLVKLSSGQRWAAKVK